MEYVTPAQEGALRKLLACGGMSGGMGLASHYRVYRYRPGAASITEIHDYKAPCFSQGSNYAFDTLHATNAEGRSSGKSPTPMTVNMTVAGELMNKGMARLEIDIKNQWITLRLTEYGAARAMALEETGEGKALKKALALLTEVAVGEPSFATSEILRHLRARPHDDPRSRAEQFARLALGEDEAGGEAFAGPMRIEER